MLRELPVLFGPTDQQFASLGLLTFALVKSLRFMAQGCVICVNFFDKGGNSSLLGQVNKCDMYV